LTEQDVAHIVQVVAPKYKLDPKIVLAICEKESRFDHTEVRMENGFYRRYARPQDFTTCDEVLLSASYGLMQVMGWSLWEDGYFGVDGPKHYGFVMGAIDKFMTDPIVQIEWGCKHLQKKFHATGDMKKAVRAYNGSGPLAEAYADAIYARADSFIQHFT
jgi:soluble lytic murein transglycosylase-like protein